MAILVDPAVWPWRDDRWAHLVSDVSQTELHDFAQRLGLRRISFQGDHYDVRSVTRLRALELGAEAITSRELVSRLRASGLRHRDKIVPWSASLRRVDVSQLALMQRSGLLGESLHRVVVALVAEGDPDHVLVSVFERPGEVSVMVEGMAPGAGGRPWWPVQHRTAALDGTETVELFDVVDS